MISFGEVLGWVLSWRRQRKIDERESTDTLAQELDKLADLMSEVLNVTTPDGHIDREGLPQLDHLRKRVWNRWVSILDTHGYASRDKELQTEIEKCIRIVHAAPGAYVEEIYLAQVGIERGYLPPEVRQRFAASIDSLRDLVASMRLNR